MRINVHGGHNRTVPGIISYLDEVTEDRKIKSAVIKLLRVEGHTVYDCTDDAGKTQKQNLANIVKKCNAHNVDLDVSIHINGCTKSKRDGKTKGVEVLVYSDKSKAKDEAERICKKIAALGFTNRGIKVRSDLYVLHHTKAPALLVEVCFADDEDDAILYKKVGVNKIAKAIVEGITAKKVTTSDADDEPVKVIASKNFKVKTKTVMNIRKNPGVLRKKVGSAPVSVYTITETKYSSKTPWGKLKSGAGWICIDSKYCTRV